jgi:1-acyl-sn-glycerol-3-phosphate acyltransferase
MMAKSPAKHLRAVARVCALCSVITCVYLFWFGGGMVISFFPTAFRKWRGIVLGAWARAIARVAGMRISTQGVPPRGAFLLVSNHLSYMDVVALASRLNCVFVAKSEVARWPVIGLLCRSMKMIFINRRRQRSIPATLKGIEQMLASGSGVVLFAEGTSTGGAGVAPFMSSLLEFAARERIPVHVASLSYRTPPGEAPARESVCWWGEMAFLKHLYALFMLPSFDVILTFGKQPIQEDNRKVLAGRLWSAVNAQFIPVEN